MKHSATTLAAMSAIALLLSPAHLLAADSPVPGSVAYVTGGIGDDERDALETARHQYTLHILSTDSGGHYVADTGITIYDRAGNTLLSAVAGPLFYAMLPPGKYSVSSSNAGAVQKKNVTISSNGASNLHFVWKD